MRQVFAKIALATVSIAMVSAIHAQNTSSPTLGETVQWLRTKIEMYGGGVQQNLDTGWKHISYGSERITRLIERSDVRASYGPNLCEFQVSWHRDFHWTRKAHQEHDKIDEDNTIATDVSADFYLYDLKEASVVSNTDYGAKVLSLVFNGKKAIDHVHGSKSFTFTRDRDDDYCDANWGSTPGFPPGLEHPGECTVKPSEAPEKYGDFPINTDTAEAVFYIPFQRDKTQDNEELEGRAAAAFNHLRDVCAAQKPKSSEPF